MNRTSDQAQINPTLSTGSSEDRFAFLHVGGEMGARVRTFDWSRTPLGSIESWPQSLTTAVGIVLSANSPMGVFWGADLVLIYNDASRVLIGNKHPDALGRPAVEVFPKIWETIGPKLASVIEGRGAVTAHRQRLRLERNDQKGGAWFDYSFNAIPRADGSVAGVFCIANEVTDRVRAEAALRETERRYRELLANAPAAIYEIDYRERRFISVNDAMCRMTGYSRPELLDMDPAEIVDDAGRALFYDRVARWLDGEEPDRDVEYHVRTKEGRTRVAVLETTFTVDESGKPHGATVVAHDITERKRAEEALRESEQHLRIATQAAGVYGWEVDVATRTVRWAENVEQPVDFPMPKTTDEVLAQLHPDDTVETTEAFERVLKEGGDFQVEYRVIHPDTGEVIWLRSAGVSIVGEDGVPVRFVGVTQDITERKRAEIEREQLLAERMAIMENMADGLTVADPDGHFIYRNPASLALYGYETVEESLIPRDQWLGMWEVEDLAGQPVPMELWPMARALRGDTFKDYRIKVRRIDTEMAFIGSYSGTLVLRSDGRPLFAMTTVRDITETTRTEEALRRSQMDLRRAQEVGQMGSWRLDVQDDVLTWSDEVYRIFGVPQGTLLTFAAFLAMVHPDDRQRLVSRWEDALHGAAYDIEHRIVVDGRVKWVREKAYLEYDDQGNVLGGFGIVQEITQRKQAEEALQRSVAQFQALFNQMTEGLVLFDPEGNLLDMNPAALAVHGFDSADSLRRHLNDLTEIFDLFDMEGHRLDAADWPIGRVLRGETFDRYEVRVRRLDTGRTWIGSYGGTPVYGPDGQLLLAIVTLRDVTAQREAAWALIDARRRLRAALNGGRIATWVWDLRTDRVYSDENTASFFDLAEDGRPLPLAVYTDAIHPVDRPQVMSLLDQAIRTGEDFVAEYRIIARNRPRWVYSRGRVERDPDGPVRLAGVIVDITERKQAEEALRRYTSQLEALNETNRLLLREVNHRVKNNLATILGMIFAEQRRLRLEAEACDEGPDVEHSRTQAALDDLSDRVRSLATVHNLLSAGGWRPLRMDKLIEAVIRASMPAAHSSGKGTLEVTVNGEPVSVASDKAHHVAMTIGELTTNSLKYGDGAQGVRIRVEISVEDGVARILYRDWGPGYPEPVLAGECLSVGLELVRTIVTHSLRGSWQIRNDAGAVTELCFPLSYDAEGNH